jgi:hypothetical protein
MSVATSGTGIGLFVRLEINMTPESGKTRATIRHQEPITRYLCPKEQQWLSLSEMAYRQIAKSATDTASGAVSALKADVGEEEIVSSVTSEVA